MISPYQSSLTALKAFGKKIQSSSNNVSNADTDGFKKTRVTMTQVSPQGVRAQVNTVDTPGATDYRETSEGLDPIELSNVELGHEIAELIVSSAMYKANLKTVETFNKMTGALLNIKS